MQERRIRFQEAHGTSAGWGRRRPAPRRLESASKRRVQLSLGAFLNERRA